MSIEIKMPSLGQITDEVKLLSWFVKEGQKIKKGDPLCEVETDKTTMDVESFESGTVLKLYAKPGATILAGAVIAVLGEPYEEVREVAKVKATPLVKNIAREKNINLEYLKGTGAQGLITRKDLEGYLRSTKTRKRIKEKVNVYPLTQSQQAVATNLTRSKKEIPHYYLKTHIFIDSVLKWREENRNIDDIKVSIYSLFIYAIAKALREYPKLNGYFKDNKINLYNKVNVGFAVASNNELYVPVIHNADSKEIREIDKEVKLLIEKVQNEELEQQDISDCTFTISNLGMLAVDEFYAIINPPQAAIIAVGGMKKTLHIDKNNTISIRNVCSITGSFDHRIVNGAQGAAFIEKIKKILEEI